MCLCKLRDPLGRKREKSDSKINKTIKEERRKEEKTKDKG